jgi:hypothetical protein
MLTGVAAAIGPEPAAAFGPASEAATTQATRNILLISRFIFIVGFAFGSDLLVSMAK